MKPVKIEWKVVENHQDMLDKDPRLHEARFCDTMNELYIDLFPGPSTILIQQTLVSVSFLVMDVLGWNSHANDR